MSTRPPSSTLRVPFPLVPDDDPVAYAQAYRLAESCDPAAGPVFAELAERYPDDGLIAFYAVRLEAGMTGVTIRMSEK